MDGNSDPPPQDDLDHAAVSAAGKVSEALEMTERARCHLYSFRQLTGHADVLLDDAVQQLKDSGYPQLAEHLTEHLIGRNVLSRRWTFQVIDQYDDGYCTCFKDAEKLVRQRLTSERRRVFEAAMKERRRTHGHSAHIAASTNAESMEE